MGRQFIHSPLAVLHFIIRYKREHDGVSPSIREISDACSIPSSSNVHVILRNLERDGYITTQSPAARTIQVVGGKRFIA